MKVCYVAPYRDGTGYSIAAIENMMALDSVGVDVVARSTRMTKTVGEVPDRIRELEAKSVQNVDVIIQHNLPSEFCHTSKAKNIGIFYYETNSIPSFWVKNLITMDKLIFPCTYQRDAMLNTASLMNIDLKHFPMDVIGSSFNPRVIDKPHEKKMDFGVPKNYTKFYTIGEFNERKNYEMLFLAYFSAFSLKDPVVLVVKTSGDIDLLKKKIDDIKRLSRKNASPDGFPKVVITNGRLSTDEMINLHRSCDVFVSPSHGESWSLPTIDALACGNFIIASESGAFRDYLKDENSPYSDEGFFFNLIPGFVGPVSGVESCPDGLYTSNEKWFYPDLDSLCSMMINRVGWNNSNKYTSEYAIKNFSREVIGNKLKKSIEGIL